MDTIIDNQRMLSTEALWIDNFQIWFSSMAFNGLYRYNLKNKQISFMGSFIGETHNAWRLHGKVLKFNEELFFLPNRSKYLHVYNITKKSMEAYDLKIIGRINCKNAIFYNGFIYFVSEFPEITLCQINIETKEIKKKTVGLFEYRGGICLNLLVVDKKLYFACVKKNIIVEYDLEIEKIRLYKVPQNSEGFGTIDYDGRFFWLSSTCDILKWEKSTNNVEKYNEFPKGFGMTVKEDNAIVDYIGFIDKSCLGEKPFWCSTIIKNYLWLFPFRANMIIKINLLNNIITEFFLPDEMENRDSLFMKTRRTHCHYLGGTQENRFLFFSTKSKKVYILNSDGTISNTFFRFWATEPENLEVYLCNDLPIMIENEKVETLDAFLSVILSNGNKKNSDNTIDMGKAIFKRIRSYLYEI